jgi:hypothetical protein
MINITFRTDTAAFDGLERGPEIARILRQLAATLEARSRLHLGYEADIRDANGNKVGEVVVSHLEDDED